MPRLVLVFVLLFLAGRMEGDPRRRSVGPGAVTVVLDMSEHFDALVERPDGAIAFVGKRAGFVDRGGNVWFFPGSTTSSAPFALGRDGVYWSGVFDGIRRIDSAGRVAAWTLRDGAGLSAIVADRERMVFVERAKDRVGWIAADGEIRELLVPPALDGPFALFDAGGGELWVVGRRAAGRLSGQFIDTVHVVDEDESGGFIAATLDGDGAIWLLASSGSLIRMSPAGEFQTIQRLPAGISGTKMSMLPDGSFLLLTARAIHRVHRDGRLQSYRAAIRKWEGIKELAIRDMIVTRSGTVWLALDYYGAGGVIATLDVD